MRRFISLITSLLLLLTAFISYVCVKSSAELPTALGKDHAIVRIFDKDGISPVEISNIRFAAEEASTADTEDDGRLWCDAYSYFTEVNVSRSDSDAVGCQAIVTGGDFFLFHGITFKKGWYYSDTDLHLDRVVIDERLAFELYGSNDVEDMTLTLGPKTLYVAGVVAMDEGRAKELQLGTKPLIYLPQHIAESILGERNFESYEIMMQNPVDSYAVNALASVTEGKEVVDVTNRFGLGEIFKVIREFPTRSYRTSSAVYPYWENSDRGTEDLLALLLTVNAVLTVAFAVNIIIFIIERKKR